MPNRFTVDASQGSWLGRRAFLAGGMSALAAVPAFAQGRTDADATGILRQLAPQDRVGRVPGRAVRRAPRRVVDVTISHGGVREVVRIDLSRRVEITVFFANDSTELGAGAQRALFHLATALRDDILADQNFLVAGHTNTVGDRLYNIELSAGRALAVRNWLVGVGGVGSERLITHGFGPDMLRNPSNPASPVNRRVEIIALDA